MQMLMTVCQVAVDGEASRLLLLVFSMIVLAVAVIINVLYCGRLERRIRVLERAVMIVAASHDAHLHEHAHPKLRPLTAPEYRGADRSKSQAHPQSSSRSAETATDAARDPR